MLFLFSINSDKKNYVRLSLKIKYINNKIYTSLLFKMITYFLNS